MRPGSMRKRIKWAIGLLIVVLSVPVLGAAWIYVAMNGGIYSILLNMKSRPDLDSPDLKRDRSKLEQQIGADFSRDIPNDGFFHYATSTQDACYDGANNWKHRDGFAHRCTLRVTNFYGLDGDFRKTMLDFERGLLAAGWHSNIHDMEWALTRNDAAAPNDRTVGHLPNPYPYYKGGSALDICWTERGSPRLFDLKNIQAHGMGWVSENTFYDQRNLTDASNVFREVTRDHQYILAVAINGHYFEN
jgi:hypothetical protein